MATHMSRPPGDCGKRRRGFTVPQLRAQAAVLSHLAMLALLR